jgi:hypothetical protein
VIAELYTSLPFLERGEEDTFQPWLVTFRHIGTVKKPFSSCTSFHSIDILK